MGNGNVVTDWAQPDSSESAASSCVLRSRADEIAQAMLGLLAEMEASLQGSQKAILARDGLGLENCAREQVRLHRALELFLWPRAWPGTAAEAEPETEKDALLGTPQSAPESVPQFVAECSPFLAAEMLAAERRVLQGTRARISGVSLDEDAANVMQYQQACDASAKANTTIHNMMYAVVNLSRFTT
jgi:hypothetical protein